MIPLNKALVNVRGSVDLSKVLKNWYPERYNYITFSARQALNIAYKQLFVDYGSCEIAVSPLTCFEALTPIISNNHLPRFIDIDTKSFLMDSRQLPQGIKFVQAIHLGGFPQKLDFLSDEIVLIEDCAQALGAKIGDRFVGSFGNYAAFSFLKTIHAIGGGMLLTKSELEHTSDNIKPQYTTMLYRKLKQGLERRVTYKRNISTLIYNMLLYLKPDSASTAIKELSPNKAIFRSISRQLAIFTQLIERRNFVAKNLLSGIDPDKFIPQKAEANTKPIYTRLFLVSKGSPASVIIKKLRDKGIAANNLTQSYISSYQESIFENPDFRDFASTNNLRNYTEIHNRLFCIPVSPALSDSEMQYIQASLNQIS